MFNLISNLGNVNQNFNEIPTDTKQVRQKFKLDNTKYWRMQKQQNYYTKPIREQIGKSILKESGIT